MKQPPVFKVLSIFLFQTLVLSGQAQAMTAYETSPGVIEVRGSQDLGLAVTRTQQRKVGKKTWVYFCVAERRATRLSTSMLDRKNEKCFYGEPALFRQVQEGATFRSIEYGLRSRIFNGRGRIVIGAQRYFYPAYVLYSMN